jgi:flagellar hook-length control protein FliK
MLTINATTLRATVNEAGSPLPPSGPTPTPGGDRDPAGFASLLRQTRAAPMPAVAPPQPLATPAPNPTQNSADSAAARGPDRESKPESANGAANDTANATANDAMAANRRANAVTEGKQRDNANTAQRGAKPAGDASASSPNDAPRGPADKEDGADAATGTTIPPAGNAALDPTVLHWLAGLQRASTNAAAGATSSADATTLAADAAAGTARGALPDGRAAALKADTALQDKAAQGRLVLGGAAGEAGLAAVFAEQRKAETLAKTSIDTGTGTGFKDIAAAAAALAAAPAATAAERAAAAPLAVVIATPVAAPDFAQALGVQMSVLARDGIQHAELHLNPAEMGPVSVQIVMDGTQARVDFGADVAATRHAIEAGLPELASALRDAGFTLAGGGVSQHARGRSDGGDASAGSGPGTRRAVEADATDRGDAARRIARRVVSLGGLDLYA